MSTASNLEATPLDWSSNPGAFEAHLIRRHNNPYFPGQRRSVSYADLLEAQQRDNDDYIVCHHRLEQLKKELDDIAARTDPKTGDLLDLRERIHGLTYFAIEVGGFGELIAQRAEGLWSAVIKKVAAAFVNDEENLKKIRAAETYHQFMLRVHYLPVIAQIRRKDGPVSNEDMLPTLLSSDPLTIFTFIGMLPNNMRSSFQKTVLKEMLTAFNNGFKDAQFEMKLDAIIEAGKGLGQDSNDNSADT